MLGVCYKPAAATASFLCVICTVLGVCYPTDKIAHTTAFVTPVVEHWLKREIAQCVHPMKDRFDDPSHHERTLLPRSYISLPSGTKVYIYIYIYIYIYKVYIYIYIYIYI